MDVQKAVESILDGLYTDGAHHKQECLEDALLALTGYDTVESYIRFAKGEEFIEIYGYPNWD